MVIISTGPSHTVAAALERQPVIASKAYFVGMQGSVRKGYDGGAVAAEEVNMAKVLGLPEPNV